MSNDLQFTTMDIARWKNKFKKFKKRKKEKKIHKNIYIYIRY